jgi:SAM-dependent methyltransferase
MNEDVDVGNQIWEDLSPWAWRNSIYTTASASNCMGKLFKHELALFETLTFAQGTENTTVIEVGCGTAELFGAISQKCKFKSLIGVEISHNMVKCAHEVHPHLVQVPGCHVIQGNAVDLNAVIKEKKLPVAPCPIVCILMNTYGILPPHVRGLALRQMWQAIADGGTLVLGNWNREELRTGFEEFYSQNPQLCGPCTEADFDFAAGRFDNPRTGYSSQWWDEASMRRDLEDAAPFDVTIKFVRHGVGIFALGKRTLTQ